MFPLDLQGWSIEDKLRLPDWCFGRRYIVSVTWQASAYGTDAYDISEDCFPEEAVIWEVVLSFDRVSANDNYVRLALGSQLPANEAGFMELEPLLRGFGLTGPEPRKIRVPNNFRVIRFCLRQYFAPGGRRLVVFNRVPTTAAFGSGEVIVVVSGLPKEVPDWLISGQVKSP